MLARTFMSAEQLNIAPEHHAAFVELLYRLETGKMRHVKSWHNDFITTTKTRSADLFNMATWRCDSTDGCGTVCCLGGAAELIGGFSFWGVYARICMPAGLRALFYPPVADSRYITIRQAARALDCYLRTGDPGWEIILRLGSIGRRR